MSNNLRLCRICLEPEGAGEHVPIFEDDSKVAEKIYLCSGVKVRGNIIRVFVQLLNEISPQIIPSASSMSPALICNVCLKDLSKAMNFRNRAIRAEKYFKRSDAHTHGNPPIEEHFEPEVCIKLEDEDLGKIKSEPVDDDPNYELMQNIDSMVENTPSSVLAFVDAFRPKTEFYNFDRKRKGKQTERTGLEDFGSSSGVVRCKLCMKSFTSVNSHQNHMKTVHREMDESEMHKCKYCNRYFKLKIYLNRHVARIHAKQKSSMSRSDSKRKADSIFHKEDVSLYCEVS